jgi:hypothetical protein
MRSIPILVASLLASPLLAQPSPVSVSLAPNGPTVGDRVEATIAVTIPAANLAGEPRFPAWGTTWGEVEIVEKGQPAKTGERDGAVIYQQRLVLAAFRPGQVPLPPVVLAVPLRSGTIQASTPAKLALAVRSVIPQSEKNPKPKPPAPLQSLPWGERFWWTAAALMAACLGASAFLLRRPKPAAIPAAPPLAPFDELVAELQRLASEPSALALHIRLSLALRRYLARRLPFPALESTTSEIQRQLLCRRMPAALARQTVELLRACDLVKFARQPVDEARARDRVAVAYQAGQEFEVQLAPREPQRLEAAG